MPIARRIGRLPANQANSGQRSTAPATPPASITTAISQMTLGTISQLITNGAMTNAVSATAKLEINAQRSRPGSLPCAFAQGRPREP